MPGGVPVATVALNGAKNAGILAAQIIGASDKNVLDKIIDYKEGLKQKVIDGGKSVSSEQWTINSEQLAINSEQLAVGSWQLAVGKINFLIYFKRYWTFTLYLMLEFELL